MTGKDIEHTDERGYDPGPWWADLGTWGAIALIVFGALAAAWVYFRLPGTPEELAAGYYQAARIITIGLVIVGCTVLGRRRDRAAATEEPEEPERA
ncbi:hypothetical protein [Streptomyces canus]|uniref:hypothetical protein n=1 Tax=Streptomyces canus TaxID=58343 RepID=UPI00037364AE|nr:hypothetical protein [Streptomyces canus]